MSYLKYLILIILVKSKLNEVGAIKAETLKIKIISLSDCALPKSDYDEENYVPHYMSAYKVDRTTTKIRANFTIDHKFGPVQAFIRTYENDNLVSDMRNLNCSQFIVHAITALLKINVTNSCWTLPGKYSFDDFDVEQLRSVMIYVWRPGRYAYEVEFRTNVGVVTCIHIVCDYVNSVNEKGRRRGGKPSGILN